MTVSHTHPSTVVVDEVRAMVGILETGTLAEVLEVVTVVSAQPQKASYYGLALRMQPLFGTEGLHLKIDVEQLLM